MKKIILVVVALLSITLAQAQDKTVTLGTNGYAKLSTFTSADNIGASDTYSVYFNTFVMDAYGINTSVKLTKLSGTPQGDLTWYGRNFDNSAWVAIDSVYFPTLQGTDTTFLFNQAITEWSDGNKYTQLKFKIHTTAATQSSRLSNIYFKAYNVTSTIIP